MNRPVALCLVASLLLLCVACAVDPGISNPSRLYVDQWVKRGQPLTYVEPMSSPARPYKALIVPFRMTQDIPYPIELSRQITNIIWEIWSQENIFPTLVYEPLATSANVDQAILLARDRGLDAVIVGEIPYFLAGGTSGQTAVSMKADVYDVKNGKRIWSMAHAGRMEAGLDEDYILFIRKNRMPQDPVYAVVAALAHDVAGQMRNWNKSLNPGGGGGGGGKPAPANPGLPSAQVAPTKRPLEVGTLER